MKRLHFIIGISLATAALIRAEDGGADYVAQIKPLLDAKPGQTNTERANREPQFRAGDAQVFEESYCASWPRCLSAKSMKRPQSYSVRLCFPVRR